MSDRQGLRYRITYWAGKTLIRAIEWPIGWAVPSRAVFEAREFDWVEGLEQLWPAIRREYEELASHPNLLPDIRDISVEQRPVIEAKRWTFYPLRLYGHDLTDHSSKCPITAKAIAMIPDCTTAFFSVLKPGAQIAPHRGAFKGYLRLHLGVVVPAQRERCGLRMEGGVYNWEEGRSLIFDDTFMHDAFNMADTERVVLYVDFIRPMPALLTVVSMGLTRLIGRSAYVQNSLRKLNTLAQMT